jgi:2-methylisocitrate lyase-like PEP mutase family enzyme
MDALRRIGQEVSGHKVINLIYGGKTPLLTSDQLHELGFKIVLYSTPALYTAASAMLKSMSLLRETRSLGSISDHCVGFREFQQFIECQYFQRAGGDALARTASPPQTASARDRAPWRQTETTLPAE